MNHFEKHYFGTTEMKDVTELIYDHFTKAKAKLERTNTFGGNNPVVAPLSVSLVSMKKNRLFMLLQIRVRFLVRNCCLILGLWTKC